MKPWSETTDMQARPRAEALSAFAQVSDHGILSPQNGRRFRAEAAGIVPDRLKRGEMQRRPSWKLFLKYPLRVSSVSIAALSHTK